ncbi:hypothetical protein ACCS64_38430, partial [Rhizobium ruizarguesonis]
IEKLRGNIALAGAMSAITAAVVGVILNLAIWFALHTLFFDERRTEEDPEETGQEGDPTRQDRRKGCSKHRVQRSRIAVGAHEADELD